MGQNTNIYYLTAPMGQESMHGLAGSLWRRVSHETTVELSAGAVVLSRFDWGRTFPHSLTWPLQASGAFWLSPVHIRVAFSNSQHGSWLPLNKALRQRERQRKRGRDPARQKSPSFYNFLEVTSHNFCHILFIRSQSLGSVHTHGRDTQGHESRGEAHWRPF